MADKNVVDDYYSNIQPDSKDEKNQTGAKPKVKPKRKIVVKKPSEKKEVTAKKPVAKKTTSPRTDKKIADKKPAVKKQFVQKIEVVKKAEQPTVVKKQDNSGVEKKSTPNFNDAVDSSRPLKNSKKSKKHVETKKDDNEVNAKKIFGHKKTRGKIKNLDEDFTFSKTNKLAKRKKEEKKVEDIQQNLTDRTGETVVLPDVLSLKEFSEKIGVTLPMLMAEFMKNGMMVNINSKVDFDTASIVADAFNIKVQRDNSS
jgi:translation initiation factor IF-2